MPVLLNGQSTASECIVTSPVLSLKCIRPTGVSFISLSCALRKGDLQSAAFSTLRQHVGERVASEGGGAFGGCLTGHALGALRNLAAQPGIKAVARVFETPHPYQNNMVS